MTGPDFNRVVGAYVFGNTAGVAFNLRGALELSRARFGLPMKPSMTGGARKLREDGYLRFERIADAEAIARTKRQFVEIIEDEKLSAARKNETRGATTAYSRVLVDAGADLEEARALVTEPLVRLLESFYGSHVSVFRILAWRNYHVPPDAAQRTEVFSNFWHCDTRPTSILKLFVNLSTVTHADGPFQLLPRPMTGRASRRLALRFTTHGWHRTPRLPDELHAVPAVGPPGSAMLCNTELCLHRAGVPLPGRQRDIVQIQFKPSREPLAPDWRPTGDCRVVD